MCIRKTPAYEGSLQSGNPPLLSPAGLGLRGGSTGHEGVLALCCFPTTQTACAQYRLVVRLSLRMRRRSRGKTSADTERGLGTGKLQNKIHLPLLQQVSLALLQNFRIMSLTVAEIAVTSWMKRDQTLVPPKSLAKGTKSSL